MSFSWLRLLLILLLTAGLAASSATHGALPQDAYVWQRQWTPAVKSAMDHSADLVRAWRVLAARSDGDGRLRTIAVDWAVPSATHRPVIAVIRIDGQLAHWDEAQLLADIRDLRQRWHDAAVPIAGIEIDHDCATPRLPAYARFLRVLHDELAGAALLSITALPTWLGSRALDDVLAVVDEAVLQVHAAQDPRVGLFDPATALRWIEAMGRRTTKPFRVALPTYGTRVSWAADGRLRAIESERRLLIDASAGAELVARPREVAALLRGLERSRPATLAGIVWFRLPTDGDMRAWSLATWRAVIRGEPVRGQVRAEAVSSPQPGLSDIRLVNSGDVDVDLPRRILLPADCGIADGINGYDLAQRADGTVLQRQQSGLLHGHHQQTIGWMRCTAGLGDIRVQP